MWICRLKPAKANSSVTLLMFRAVGAHAAGLRRVKQIIVGISCTALCRACVPSAVKGHLSRKTYRERQRESSNLFLQKQELQRIMAVRCVQLVLFIITQPAANWEQNDG